MGQWLWRLSSALWDLMAHHTKGARSKTSPSLPGVSLAHTDAKAAQWDFSRRDPWGTSVYRTLLSVWLVITAECASFMDFVHRYFCFLTAWVVLKAVEPISAHPTAPWARLGLQLAPVVKSHSSLLDQASRPLLAGFTTRAASGGSCGSGSKEAFAGLGVRAGTDRQWGRRAQRNW